MTMVKQKLARLGGFCAYVLVVLAIILIWKYYSGERLAKLLHSANSSEFDMQTWEAIISIFAEQAFSLILDGGMITTIAAAIWVVASAFFLRPRDPVSAANKIWWSASLLLLLISSCILFYWKIFASPSSYGPTARFVFPGAILAINLFLFWLASCMFTWRPLRPGVPGASWWRW